MFQGLVIIMTLLAIKTVGGQPTGTIQSFATMLNLSLEY
jgi:hypothetical protein